MTVHPLPSAFPGVARSLENHVAGSEQAKAGIVPQHLPRGLDRELYLVECFAPGRTETHFPEQFPGAMTFSTVVDAILVGAFEDVAHVIYFNPAENFSRDVSEDIARAVADKARNNDWPITRKVLDFIEDKVSMTYARGLQLTNGEMA